MPTHNPQDDSTCPTCGTDGRPLEEPDAPNRAIIVVCDNGGCSVDRFFGHAEAEGPEP